MRGSPNTLYTFSPELAALVKRLAKEGNLQEHEVFKRALGLYHYAKKLEQEAGRLLVEREDGSVRVLHV